jgi:hypothetical protein
MVNDVIKALGRWKGWNKFDADTPQA